MSDRRLKSVLLLTGVVLSALVFLGWTQQWFSVVLAEGPVLAVGGDKAAPALSTLALTSLVLIGALSIAGPFFRVVLGVLESLLGVTVVLSGAIALANPVTASGAVITDATGVAGTDNLAAQVATVSIAFWPWISTIAGALLVLAGLAVVLTSRRWPGSSRKYSAVRLEPVGDDPVADWDAQSHGEDPTSR